MMMIPLVLFVHFWFTEKKNTKEIGCRFIFVSLLTFTHECTWTFTWCLCVCVVGFVGCLMTGLIIYLFQDFRVTLMCFRWFQKVSSRCFHIPGGWYLKARVGRLSDSVWTPLLEELGSLLIQKVSQTQCRWIEKWCVDDDEALCVTSLKLPLWLLLNERSDSFSLRAVLLRLTSEKSCGRLSETMRHWLSQLFILHDVFAPQSLRLTSPRCY